MSKKTIALIIALVALVVGVPVALVLLRVIVFAPFRIPSAAMYPSLPAHIWVSKSTS